MKTVQVSVGNIAYEFTTRNRFGLPKFSGTAKTRIVSRIEKIENVQYVRHSVDLVPHNCTVIASMGVGDTLIVSDEWNGDAVFVAV